MTDPAVLAAIERDFIAAWWLLGEVTDAERHDEPSLRWFRTGMPEAYCNQVVVTRLDDAEADATIEELRTRLGGDGTPFTWWVMPSFAPADLATRLERQGLERGGTWPGFALRIGDLVEPPAVPGLDIRRVDGEADLASYVGIVAQTLSPSTTFTEFLRNACRAIGFGEDALEEHLIGLLDGVPVASASLMVAGGAAGIYNVATLAPARGRGIGAAMTAAVIRRGAARGLSLATLQASSMGRPIYERLGFRFVCDLVPFRSPARSTPIGGGSTTARQRGAEPDRWHRGLRLRSYRPLGGDRRADRLRYPGDGRTDGGAVPACAPAG
jgi:GNAT superfamily N-acetyltransferase